MDEQTSRIALYIEDDPEMIDLVSTILNRQGFAVKGAHGGRQGLELVSSLKPDVILLDLMMPDLDGWDVYQSLKSNSDTRDIPVIVITARSQTIDKVLGLHIARVDDYICKPFHPEDLLESLKRVMTAHASASNG